MFYVLVLNFCGRPFGNSCSLGLRYVILVLVSDCQFSFFHIGEFLSDCTIS